MKAVLLACLLVLLVVDVSNARMRRVAPIRIRMVAYIGEKVEGARPNFSWLVTCQGKRYQLYVLELRVLGGNATPLDIDAALAPYTVKFQVAGDKTALAHFKSTPPRQQVLLTGYLRLDPAARFLMLDTVDAGPALTPVPAEH